MKNLLNRSLFLLITAATIISCGDDDPVQQDVETRNIIQLAQANGFNALAAALERADLIDDLQAAGPFTVFAPTDAQFAGLLETIGQSSIDDIPVPVLTDILLYHVVSGSVLSGDVTDTTVPTLLSGNSIELTTDGGIKVNGASVIEPFDVEASNGVIHTIDGVLVPADILQFVNTVLEPAYFSVNFTTLIEAAVKADVVGTLLNADALTIFAPTNDAFSAAGVDVSALSGETLASVLTYHVVGAKVLSTGIPASATTLNENDIFFSLVDAGNFINGNTEITAVDIESGTGVVHVIDNVLMPPAGDLVDIAIGADPEFTSLVAALTRTTTEGDENLVTVLQGDGPFTVFAPTNAAFQALLDSNEEWSALGDIPIGTLVNVLKYHVVPARAYDKDLAGAIDENNELPTALGQNVSIDLSNLTVDDAGLIVTSLNINATNGVIHAIDAVLLPAQ